MSTRLSVALVAIACLSTGIAVGTLWSPRTVSAAKEPERFTPPRIAYVNIAKVMREFEMANAESQKIKDRRQEWEDRAKVLKTQLEQKSNDLKATNNPAEQEVIRREALTINRKLEELNLDFQKEMGELTDRTIVEVYTNVRDTITDLAGTLHLDVIECFPNSPTPEDEKKPVVAQMKLQTPGLMPFYIRKDLDVTDDVIKALNKKFPAKKGPLKLPAGDN